MTTLPVRLAAVAHLPPPRRPQPPPMLTALATTRAGTPPLTRSSPVLPATGRRAAEAPRPRCRIRAAGRRRASVFFDLRSLQCTSSRPGSRAHRRQTHLRPTLPTSADLLRPRPTRELPPLASEPLPWPPPSMSRHWIQAAAKIHFGPSLHHAAPGAPRTPPRDPRCVDRATYSAPPRCPGNGSLSDHVVSSNCCSSGLRARRHTEGVGLPPLTSLVVHRRDAGAIT
ncbi:hypothetical protein ACQJBY_032877 [Aegilops geniculata]